MNYKRNKFKECNDSSSQTWALAKNYMDWTSAGPPSRIEIEKNGALFLVTKAADIAKIMNEYFISKVQTIVMGLKDVPNNLSGCKKLMLGKKVSMSLQYVSVKKVRHLVSSLKNKKSTSVDQLDNFAVKIAADYLAKPLHHVITLSIMQEKFPTCWKYAKVIPLHKKNSPIKKENYRPVAILSSLSKF